MQITITTRHLLHMLKEAYTMGSKEVSAEIFTANPQGRPEIAATDIIMKNLQTHADYMVQQS